MNDHTQIDVNVTRADIVWFSGATMFRARANIQLLTGCIVFFAFLNWINDMSDPAPIDWLSLIGSSLLFGFAVFVGVFAISLLFVLFSATTKSGVLGEHSYTIESDGLRETTTANDSLHYWNSIEKLEKLPTAILVQVSSYLYHVLPRREFESREEYDEFFEILCQRKQDTV